MCIDRAMPSGNYVHLNNLNKCSNFKYGLYIKALGLRCDAVSALVDRPAK